VNEGDGTDVQACLVHMGRTGAVGLQSLCDHPQKDAQHHAQHRSVALHEVTQASWARTAPTGAPAGGGIRDRSGALLSPPSAAWCTRGRLPGLCSRAHSRRSERGQSHGQRCRTQDTWQTLCARRAWGCGGRPGRRTDPRWPTLARSRSARLPFGRAACVRGGVGCRAWAWKWLT
jgi:hypothetical protein